jgi:hypothetical protein
LTRKLQIWKFQKPRIFVKLFLHMYDPLPPSLPPPPPPPPAATASTSPVTMWTGTTTLSHLDWNYYSPRHLEWNLWNSGTAAAVAATFVSLQLGAFEHH